MLVLPDRTACFRRFGATLTALLLTSLAWLGRANAEDTGVVAAANAFGQAQQAELKGDHDRAAELFELADRIAPTPEALRSATRARLAAGQLALAADDAELLLARHPDDASRQLAEEVLSQAKPELIRYTFQCSDPCTVVVDGSVTMVAPERTQVVYLAPGTHDLELGFVDDATHRVKLTGSAGEARTIKVAKPAPKPRAVEVASEDAPISPPRKRGLHPAYFWSGVALTAVAGGLTLWSGLDLLNAKDDFEKNPTRAKFDDGQSKDTRTSVLLGVTGVLAVGTITSAFFTNFKSERATASIGFDGRSAQLNLRGRF